jgi:hypothetical protein
MKLSRREFAAAVLAAIGAAGFSCTTKSKRPEEATTAGTLTLRLTGDTHQVPRNFFGLNTSVNFDVPWEDPKFAAAVKDMAPGHLRFPGGQNGNYFDWRSGLMKVPDPLGGVRTAYRQIQDAVNRLHPNGVTYKQFNDFADVAGAEILFMPNLECSPVDEQGAWLASIKATSIPPRLVEMGTEFWLGGLGNPASLARWPNWAATRDLTKQYVDAFRPYLPPDARFALQAAGSQFYAVGPGGPAFGGLGSRMQQWDQDLTDDGWYQAITTHLYPRIESLVAADVLAAFPQNVDQVYSAALGRIDAGIDREVDFLRQKLPDKEIWITEWSAGSAALSTLKLNYANGMWFQFTARGLLAVLRSPAVTLATYHSLMLSDALSSVWVRDAGGYRPVSWFGLLKWFHLAAQGAKYSRIEVQGATRIAGSVPGDSYNDVDAALLEKNGAAVAFIHNASSEDKTVSLHALRGGTTPTRVEAMVTPDLVASLQSTLPEVRALRIANVFTLPAYSMTRVEWS